MDKRKVSALLLDIKGGFDNVNPSTLCDMLSAKEVTDSWYLELALSLRAGPATSFSKGPPKPFPRCRWAPPKAH